MKSKLTLFILCILFGNFCLGQNNPTNFKCKINTDYNFLKKNSEENFSDSVYLYCRIGNQFIATDSCKLASDSTFKFTLNFNGIRIYRFRCRMVQFELVLEAGKDVDIIFSFNTNIQGKGIELDNKYDDCFELLQTIDNIDETVEIISKDTAEYNKMLNDLLVKGNLLLDSIKQVLPNELYNELYYYHQYNWAYNYLEYIRERRAFEPYKKFNFVSPNHLSPILHLLNLKEEYYESSWLKDDIKEIADSLVKYNYETRFLKYWEKDCNSIWGGGLHADTDGKNCVWGYKSELYWIIEPQYEEAQDFYHNNLGIVRQNGKYGVINECNHFVIQPQYEWLKWLDDTKLYFRKKGKYGILNINNMVLVPPIYFSLNDFRYGHSYTNHVLNKLVFQVQKNGKFGLMDTNGNLLVKPIYEKIEFFTDGYFKVYKTDSTDLKSKQGKYYHQMLGVIDSTGNEIVKIGNHNISFFRFKNELFFQVTNILFGKTFNKQTKKYYYQEYDGKLGISNNLGNKIIPHIYDEFFNYGIYYNYESQEEYNKEFIILIKHEKVSVIDNYYNNDKYYLFDKQLNGVINKPANKLYFYKNCFIICFNDSNYCLAKYSLPLTIIDTFTHVQHLYKPSIDDFSYNIFESKDYNELYFLAVTKNGKVLLLDTNLVLNKSIEYDTITKLDNWYLANKESKVFVLDKSLKMKNTEGFDYFHKWQINWYKAKKGNTIYIYDTNFNILFTTVADDIYIRSIYQKNFTGIFAFDKYLSDNLVIIELNNTLYNIVKTPFGFNKNKLQPKQIFAFTTFINATLFPGLSRVEYYNGLFIICNKDGKIILKEETNNYEFDDNSKDIYYLRKYFINEQIISNKNLLFNLNGDTLLKMDYSIKETLFEEPDSQNTQAIVNEANNYSDTVLFGKAIGYIIETNNKYGIVNNNYKLILDKVYSDISRANGFLLAFKNKRFIFKKRLVTQNDSFLLFNNNFKKLLAFGGVNNVYFLKDSVLKIEFANHKNAIYSVTEKGAIKLNWDEIVFDKIEPVYWAKKNKKYYLFSLDNKPLNTNGFDNSNDFIFGIASVKLKKRTFVLLKNGKKIDQFLIPLNKDLKTDWSLKYSKDFINENENRESLPLKIGIHNQSNLRFSIYENSNKSKSLNFKKIEFRKDDYNNRNYYNITLLNDSTQTTLFNNAVNLAILNCCGWFRGAVTTEWFNLDFVKQTDHLFQFSEANSYYGKNYSNYFIANDSLFNYSDYQFSIDLIGKKKDEFNLLFYNKVKSINGINWQSCINPNKAFYFFNKSVKMEADSMVFILKNVEVYNRNTEVSISYSYNDLIPFIKPNSLLLKWINRKE